MNILKFSRLYDTTYLIPELIIIKQHTVDNILKQIPDSELYNKTRLVLDINWQLKDNFKTELTKNDTDIH
jgi:hypothetical protein